ncbi:MAG: glycosyltransferase, partial [Flavobacteriales bacterium]|nr:glycosyltransferase [Flavobacteriales bacterium]
MNILFLTHNDIQKDIGGIESHIILLASELIKTGHQPYILTSQNKDGFSHSLFKGIPLLHVNKPHNTARLIWEEEMEKRATEIIVEYKIDVIHAQSSAANNLIKKRIKTPLIITFHCAFSDTFHYNYSCLKNTHSIREKANQVWALIKSIHTHLVKDEEPFLFYKNV